MLSVLDNPLGYLTNFFVSVFYFLCQMATLLSQNTLQKRKHKYWYIVLSVVDNPLGYLTNFFVSIFYFLCYMATLLSQNALQKRKQKCWYIVLSVIDNPSEIVLFTHLNYKCHARLAQYRSCISTGKVYLTTYII